MTAVAIALAFALGSIPFGVIVAKRMGVDIKAHGSGNIGATNVTRVIGLGPGLVTLVLDALKGALAVALANLAGGPWTLACAGYAAVLGHCFSPLLGGKGGKGVATAFGVFVVLAPPFVAVAVVVFLVVLKLSRVPALGSLAGFLVLTALLVWRGDAPTATLGCATLALLVYTHRANLAKLR
ncbi:MAG: glycerol-3-phosphate acyltransferase [Kofleriaceae bacterium]